MCIRDRSWMTASRSAGSTRLASMQSCRTDWVTVCASKMCIRDRLFLYTFGGLAEELLSPIAHEGGRGLLAYFLLSILYFLVFFLFGDLLPKKSARHNARAFAKRFVGLLCFLPVSYTHLGRCSPK